MKRFVLAALLTTLWAFTHAQLTPQQANQQMQRGINLGNTLEPPYEGSWNNGPVQEYYFDDYKQAGFTSIRIPVRWDNYTDRTSPYTINTEWMDRIEQIVDWALERDLFVVINAHHEEWIKQHYQEQNMLDRFDSIWSQIAVRFSNKPEKLLFEIINEPNGIPLAELNQMNQRILSIIRNTNPTRIVLYGGHMWSNSSELIAAQIPNDDYIIGYFHSYDPWSFAGEANGKWGSTSDRNALKSKFDQVQAWSEKNNVPVTLNEFGAISQFTDGDGNIRVNDYNSRMKHYAAYVEEAINHNFSFNAWDDGGDFRIYQRESRQWNEIKDILIYTSDSTPTKLAIETVRDSVFSLTWQNRHNNADSIFIERATNNANFEKYAALDHNASIFEDENILAGNYYYYRIVLHYSDTTDIPSYPIREYAQPFYREPFYGQAFTIPGIIEAEDFDFGGQGLTYNDLTNYNEPGEYRTSENVDIEARPDSGYQIAYVNVGEWTEYTISTAQAGLYPVNLYVASLDGGGKISLASSVDKTTFTVPASNSWTDLVKIEGEIELEEGESILRLNIVAVPQFNIDRFEILEKIEELAIDEIKNTIKIYSHTQNYVRIELPYKQSGTVSFYDVNGKIISKNILHDIQNNVFIPQSGFVLYNIQTLTGKKYSGKIMVK